MRGKIFLIRKTLRYLSIEEVVNLIINNVIIFNITRLYYYFRSFIRLKNTDCICDYQKYLKGKGRPKSALVSFLRYPVYKEYYIGRLKFFFSTHGLVLDILRGLNELGYTVDLIDFYNKDFVPKKKYDVWINHTAYNFRNILERINKNVVKICFDTGA